MSEPLDHVRDTLRTRFDVQRELGRGGMATVYLARDLKHDRPVAIKVLDADFAASLGAERFVREIRLMARLNHPHILPLLDSDQADGIPYYVMPFVEGESLRDHLNREGRIPLADALRIAREVASALAYAHARDVIHRDIKPENILLSAGHAVVADFGIARALSAAADDSVTQAGIAIGTPAYMSPEQSVGDTVDGRTDIYALGTVVFEMLAGELPFRAPSTVALLARKVTGVAPRVGSFCDVPAHVDLAIEGALAREPDERLATADAFIAALAHDPGAAPPSVALAPLNAVAVLPFVSMGPDAQDEYLGDGISEELIHVLSRIPELRVVARTSAFAFKKTNLDIRGIADRLKVRRVVEGSVRRAGDRLRVTAQLIDADNAFELWTERYDRQVTDLFAVQDEIARSIARTLRDVLADTGPRLPTQLPSRQRLTTNVVAYEQYLRGRHFWSMRTPEGFRRSVEHLARALEIDDGFVTVRAALAETYATMAIYGIASPSSTLPLAREAAERALAVDDTLAEALTARAAVAIVADWDWDAAERDFSRAIRADPRYPTAPQWLASLCLVPQRRFEEARQALSTARELDPLSLSIVVSGAALEYYARNHSAAIEASRDVLRLDERFAMGHYFLGLALEQAGDLVAAAATLDRALELSSTAEIIAARAVVAAHAGDREAAVALADQLGREAEQHYVSPVLRAQIEAALGNEQRAFDLLDEGRAVHATELTWLAVRPAFDPLRHDPRFRAHLEALRFPGAIVVP